ALALAHDQRARRSEIAPRGRSSCRRRRGTEVEVERAGGRRLRFVERKVRRSGVVLGRRAAQIEIEVRCGGGGGSSGWRGSGRTATAIQPILRIDRTAKGDSLVPFWTGTVGERLELERRLLEGLGVTPVGVDLEQLGMHRGAFCVLLQRFLEDFL